MSVPIPSNPGCPTCTELNTEIPGPTGAAGAAGTNGTDGANAYTQTTANFTMPAVSGTVSVSVADSGFIGVNQVLYVEDAGYMKATAVLSAVLVTMENLGYTGNAAPTTVINSGALVTPGGIKGADGTSGGDTLNDLAPTQAKGDLMVDNGATAPTPSIVRLSVGANGTRLKALSSAAEGVAWAAVDLASASEVTGVLPVANGGTAASTAANARAALGCAASGVATGSGLTVSATDKVLGRSTAGAGAVEEIACTSIGRSVIASATLFALQTYLGINESVVTKTASYPATIANDVILCDATSGSITIGLPAAASSTGKRLCIKKIDASANTVIIDGNLSETIDGATTKTISAQWTAVDLVCDGSNWFLV